MKCFFVCLLVFSSFLSLAGPVDSLKPRPRHIVLPDETSYDFGTLMLDFVRTRAYDIAMKHLPESYAGKSINGYQILLDRGRTASNLALKVLKESDALLAAQVDAMSMIRRLDTVPGSSLTAGEAAKMAWTAELARNYCFKLGEQREQTIGFRNQMEHLGIPFSFDEFKRLGMHLIPTNFIMSTIGGSKPDFNMTISATYTMNEEGGSADNSQNIFTSFYELFSSANESWEYRQQVEKFNRALKLLPTLMPSDTTCYRIYKEKDDMVMLLYGDEPSLMKGHLDSLTVGLENRYEVMMKLVGGIENGLLYDRVRSGFAHIGLGSFSPNDLLLVRKRANEIADARELVEGLTEVILSNSGRAQVIRAKEDMLETALALVDLIRLTDSIPTYAPLKPFLLANLQWFKAAKLWAEAAAQTELSNKSAVKPYWFGDLDRRLLADINPLATARSAGSAASAFGQVNALVRQSNEGGLSISANWPLIPQGSGIGELYSEQGTGIWAKGSDGSYIHDRRKTWAGKMKQIYNNLDMRTSDLQRQFTVASAEVRSHAVNRSSEIIVQSGVLQDLSQCTHNSRASIPRQSIGNAPISTPEENRNWELDPRYHKPQTLSGLIVQEREKLEKFISGLPEDVRNSEGISALNRKHEQFLQYAAALREAGFTTMANNMVNGATSVRAAAAGQVIDGGQIPSFNIPDIPFNPFTTADENLVFERHSKYKFVSGQLGDRSLWFEAAAIVTDLSLLNLADVPGVSFIPAADFLRSTNEALFPGNIQNAVAILGGGLKGSFTTPNNEQVVFDGLSGKALDYALVEYEQSQVQAQINKYQQDNPSVSMPLITAKINFFMNNLLVSPVGASELRQAMFAGFNFADYNDRVRLGKRLIDILYARRVNDRT